MPVKDVDGGLVWQQYNPHLFTGKLPQDQYVEKPFFFGASQVPTNLGMSPSSYSGSGMMSKKPIVRSVKKLPSMRK